ncbi:MAG TPA: response regulator transcription factor, partial [Actinomycetota bacterium]|nr:response regulator transcription factor [Actinomycetota bacterium]
VLAERSDDDDALMEAVDAGADGFITKGRSMEELVEAMRRAWKGEVVIPPDMLGGLLARLTRRNKKQEEALEKVARLTPREREVLALLLEGADNEAIARELVISPETARTHVQNLMSKLGAHSRLEAVAFAMQSGIRSILLEGRSSRGR